MSNKPPICPSRGAGVHALLQKRFFAVPVLLAAALTMVGTSGVAQAAGPAPEESRSGSFAAACPASYTLSQKAAARHRAGALFRYLLGSPESVLAGDAGLSNPDVRAAAGVFRAEITGTDMYAQLAKKVAPAPERPDAQHPGTAPRITIYLAGSTAAGHGTLRSRVLALGAAVNKAFGPADGPCVNDYLLPDGGADVAVNGTGTRAFALDPEPATLTANLSTTQGATASAYYSVSFDPTTVAKWSSTYTTMGTAVYPGEPCSTVGLSSGAQATQVIIATGTYGKCQ